MAKGTYRFTEGQLEPTQLNWAGHPIRDCESYGGKPEHISETWRQKPAQAAAKHYEVITESAVCEVFGNGALRRSEVAKLLQVRTSAHRTTCYRALRLNGRFARHLRTEGAMLSWRSL